VTDLEPCPTFVADCRTRAGTDLLTHIWDPVVLSALRLENRRRSELLAAVGGMSDKVLTESLRRLTASNLIYRDGGYAAVYGLTQLGQTFVDGPLASLREWAITFSNEMISGQETG
jgi:DNA-binding HxlR family transcriptional regulator